MSNLTYKDLLLSFHEHLILIKVRFFGISDKYIFDDKYKFLKKYSLIKPSLKKSHK